MNTQPAPLRTRILIAFKYEMQLALSAKKASKFDLAFYHYERAHILSQKYTIPHIKSHIGMLQIGFVRKDFREIFGQCVRIIAALIFSKIWVPIGNSRGANVSAIKPMPIPDDLMQILK